MNAPDLPDRHPVTARQYAIASLAALALVIDGLDIQLLSLVSPLIMQEWNATRSAFGPALAAALVGMSFGASAGGWLGDRYGHKRVLAVSTVAFGAVTAIAAASSHVHEMTALRFLSGLGFGSAAPNAIALAAEWLPPRLRPRLASLLSVGTPLGGLLGAAAMIGLLPALGWRGCFVACGVVTVLLGLIMFAALRESPSFDAAAGGAASARGSMFTREYARLNVGASLAFFSIAFVAYAVITWAPAFLTMSGFTLAEALRATMAFNLAAVGAALLNSILIDRFGSRAVLLACGAGILVVLGLLFLALDGAMTPDGKLLATLAIGGCGALTGAGLAAIYALLTCAYPSACRGAGIGFGLMMARLGAIATIVSSGYLLDSSKGIAPFVVTLTVAAAFAIGGSVLIDRHIPRRSLLHLPASA